MLKMANQAATRGREVCGLIVNVGCCIKLAQVRNVGKKYGGFMFLPKDVRAVIQAAHLLESEIVGTFHSHPFSGAVPSKADIENAVNDSLMLIISIPDHQTKLWRIHDLRADELKYVLK